MWDIWAQEVFWEWILHKIFKVETLLENLRWIDTKKPKGGVDGTETAGQERGTRAAPLGSQRPVGVIHEVSLRECSNLKPERVMCQVLRAQFYWFFLFYNHKDSWKEKQCWLLACFTDENEMAVEEVKAWTHGQLPLGSHLTGQVHLGEHRRKEKRKLECSPKFRMDLKKKVNQSCSFFIISVS